MGTLLKPILWSILSCGILAACSNEPLPEPMGSAAINRDGAMINIPDTTTAITTSRALEIAARYARATPSRSSSAAESIEVATGENGEPLLYAVNYPDNNGFVIISASRQYFPILAQSETGNFHLSDITDEHPASVWLAEKKFSVQHATSLPDCIKEKIASQWIAYDPQVPYTETASSSRSDVPDKPQVFYDSLKRWSMDPNVTVYRYEDYIRTPEYQSLSQYEKERIEVGIHTYGNSNYGTPESSSLFLRREINNYEGSYLLTTTWDQIGGYNSANPYTDAVGCTTVAAGQIMKYHEHPQSYSWHFMPDNVATDYIALFLYNLGKKIGIEYTAGKTGANNTQVKKALENENYSVSEISHDRTKVLTEVAQRRPVYLTGYSPNTGTAHAWVCDGKYSTVSRSELQVMTLDYRPTSYSTPDKMVEAYKMDLRFYSTVALHFNWGWGGRKDGYFNDDSFTVMVNGVNTTYSDKRKDLTIRPNK